MTSLSYTNQLFQIVEMVQSALTIFTIPCMKLSFQFERNFSIPCYDTLGWNRNQAGLNWATRFHARTCEYLSGFTTRTGWTQWDSFSVFHFQTLEFNCCTIFQCHHLSSPAYTLAAYTFNYRYVLCLFNYALHYINFYTILKVKPFRVCAQNSFRFFLIS